LHSHESTATAQSNAEPLILHTVPFSYNFMGILSAYGFRINV